MAETKRKGDLGEALIMSEVLRRGYKVAMPVGEDWRYDLIVLRGGGLERIQCKYVESDGNSISVPCRSSNNWKVYKYIATDFDWIVVYDKTTDACYFLPSSLLGGGRACITLRLAPPKNMQVKGVRWAKDFIQW